MDQKFFGAFCLLGPFAMETAFKIQNNETKMVANDQRSLVIQT